jgi:uncharacterized protein (TIGR02145 family)
MMRSSFWLALILLCLSLLTSCRQYTATYFENRLGDLGRKTYGIPWNPFISYGTLIDVRDGHTYRTVKIGRQTWMAENLNYNAKESSCPSNSEDSCGKYGRSYNWILATGRSQSVYYKSEGWKERDTIRQGVCPADWHVPRKTEWESLVNQVGGDSIAGTALNSSHGWFNESNQGRIQNVGTDSFGFRNIPEVIQYAVFWSSSDDGPSCSIGVRFDDSSVVIWGIRKSDYRSVRCVQNEQAK